MYSLTRPHIQTFDLVLFRSPSFFSKLIRWAGLLKYRKLADWNHVGMVIKDEQHDVVMLCESTSTTTLKDSISGNRKSGFQIVPLSAKLHEYATVHRGQAAWRPLICKRTPGMHRRLAELCYYMRKAPYEKDILQLIDAASSFDIADSDIESLFCSELVATIYTAVGLLPHHIDANDWAPQDFANDIELNGAHLGRLVKL